MRESASPSKPTRKLMMEQVVRLPPLLNVCAERKVFKAVSWPLPRRVQIYMAVGAEEAAASISGEEPAAAASLADQMRRGVSGEATVRASAPAGDGVSKSKKSSRKRKRKRVRAKGEAKEDL